jgi:DNA-directed RNA polymerase specialized sigma24 family protein
MPPSEEARFIALWQEGLTTDAIAEALGILQGTARSRAYTLQQQGGQEGEPLSVGRMTTQIRPYPHTLAR